MTDRQFFLTPEGADRLRAELEELRGPRRTDLAKRLRHAVQQGDLSENADYISAKEEQAFLEGHIQELEAILREATIVEGGASDTITVGSTVVVAENGQSPQTFYLVGIKEASPREGRISNESPIGKALMGKRVGDLAVAETPGGTVKLKVIEIR
ncbi:MAG TPA: transcription elongation factor GreA [Anaerolineales bacterium]|nr:transcription elongation factor GreA [Anaerolineales bacterium]